MIAAPETFKPGERWLVARQESFMPHPTINEVQCVEWSDSGKYCKIATFFWDADANKRTSETRWSASLVECELLERLPDEKQSGSNQAEPARGTEEAGFYGICAYLNGEEVARLNVEARGFAPLWLFAQIVEQAARVRSQSNGDGVD